MAAMFALPLVAGAVMEDRFNRSAEKQRERLRQAMEAYQRSKAGEGRAATEQLMTHLTPEAREAERLGEQSSIRQSMERSVADAAAAGGEPNIAGKLSPDFAQASARGAETTADRTRKAIARLSVLQAPGQSFFNQSLRHGRAAGVVDSSNLASRNVSEAYMNDITGTQPWRTGMLVARTLQGVGQMGMAGGFKR